jgi:uncharacterized membrane protein YfcA
MLSTGIIVLYAAIGLLGGIIGGMMGLGGGILFVPCLYTGFTWMGLDTEIAFPLAVATSLSVTLVTSLSSSLGHALYGNLDPRAVLYLAVTAIPMAIAGLGISSFIGGEWLKRFFGLMAVLVSIQFIHPILKPGPKRDSDITPGDLFIVGGLSGFLSATIGVGGGILTVPLLHLVYDLPMNRAVGNSSGLIVFSSLTGTLGWIYLGWGMEGLPAGSLGYVNVIGWALISMTAVLGAQVGAWVTSSLPANRLRIPFGIVLGLVGIKMGFW